jgi:Icc-related predicted phosphoesterase
LNGVVRVAAVGDLHCGKASQGALQPLLAKASEAADVLLLCGDLTDYGLPEEARILVRELTGTVKVPIVGVFGNHDYESGHADEVKTILCDAGVHVLDGDVFEVGGVGFAGVKGFAGGFGERALQSWGEPVLKRFVREAVEEALKLEGALARIHGRRVAVLHYSPIRQTVEQEPPEVVPFLGSSRLEEPINRYGAVAAFHGHAHHGSPEGRTSTGVPVYNVSLPLLRAIRADQPFRILEIPVSQEAAVPAATAS